jgi:RNA polymerase sigma factor (TIGR02999 family)
MEKPIPLPDAAAEKADESAEPELFAVLYSELHRMARRELAKRGSDASLGATTLLHEAYLGMGSRFGEEFPDRSRFMGYAARVMRGLIIDHARSRRAIKRGREFQIVALSTEMAANLADATELTDIADAIDALAKVDAPLAELVDLKFFCGFSFAEIGAMRNVSERTVQRDWEKARIYLYEKLRVTAI